jgi:hypothetical protein
VLKNSLLVTAAAGLILAGSASLARADEGGMRIVEGTPVSIPVASNGYAGNAAAVAECPAGEFLTGGGANVTSGNSYTQHYNLAASKPIAGERWWAFATNSGGSQPGTLTAYAICAKMASVSVVSAP